MVKCRTCGTPVMIFQSDDGAVYILVKGRRGTLDNHYCEAKAKYHLILSPYMLKELGLPLNEDEVQEVRDDIRSRL